MEGINNLEERHAKLPGIPHSHCHKNHHPCRQIRPHRLTQGRPRPPFSYAAELLPFGGNFLDWDEKRTNQGPKRHHGVFELKFIVSARVQANKSLPPFILAKCKFFMPHILHEST